TTGHGSAVEATPALVCRVTGRGDFPGCSETPQTLCHVAVRNESADVPGQAPFGLSLTPDVVDESGRFFGRGAALVDDQPFWWCPPVRAAGRGGGCCYAGRGRSRR